MLKLSNINSSTNHVGSSWTTIFKGLIGSILIKIVQRRIKYRKHTTYFQYVGLYSYSRGDGVLIDPVKTALLCVGSCHIYLHSSK